MEDSPKPVGCQHEADGIHKQDKFYTQDVCYPVDHSKKMGRPSTYSQELADQICAQLAEGESLRMVCREEDKPALSTIFLWLRTHPEFSEQYARAKQESADAMADEILDIADDGTNDWEEREIAGGRTIIALNTEAVQRSKLRVDTRKWLMAKMKPKRYGEKVDVTSGGEALKGNVIVFEDFTKKDEKEETTG